MLYHQLSYIASRLADLKSSLNEELEIFAFESDRNPDAPEVVMDILPIVDKLEELRLEIDTILVAQPIFQKETLGLITKLPHNKKHESAIDILLAYQENITVNLINAFQFPINSFDWHRLNRLVESVFYSSIETGFTRVDHHLRPFLIATIALMFRYKFKGVLIKIRGKLCVKLFHPTVIIEVERKAITPRKGYLYTDWIIDIHQILTDYHTKRFPISDNVDGLEWY